MAEVVIGFGVLVFAFLVIYWTGCFVKVYVPKLWFPEGEELVDYLFTGFLVLLVPSVIVFLAYGIGGMILGTVK